MDKDNQEKLGYAFTRLKKECDTKGYCKNIYYKWDEDFNEVNK